MGWIVALSVPNFLRNKVKRNNVACCDYKAYKVALKGWELVQDHVENEVSYSILLMVLIIVDLIFSQELQRWFKCKSQETDES
jgi:hypothetical protein